MFQSSLDLDKFYEIIKSEKQKAHERMLEQEKERSLRRARGFKLAEAVKKMNAARTKIEEN